MIEQRTFILITPHMEGDDIAEFQRTLTMRFELWQIDKRVDDDGAYGSETRIAAQQVCGALGILHETAMRRGVTPDLRVKIRRPERRTEQERARSDRLKDYRRRLRERYAGKGVDAALDYAREHLGEKEITSNRSPQIDKWIRAAGLDPRMNIVPSGGVPWCGCFANACLMAAGLQNGKAFNVAAVERIVERARGEVDGWRKIEPAEGQPGDLACWQSKPFDPKNPWAHVEIVEKRVSSATYACIGGNTASASGGNPSEGGGVFRNTRETAPAGGHITLFARPPYDR